MAVAGPRFVSRRQVFRKPSSRRIADRLAHTHRTRPRCTGSRITPTICTGRLTMKIAALIFGILAGLAGLPLTVYGHALIGAGGGNFGSMFYFLPLASFLGAGVALNVPG